MNLYKFELSRYKKCIKRSVLDVEEKPKTYITTDTKTWKTRINKPDIGKVTSCDKIYLLEDDAERAKRIFAEKINEEIDYAKERIRSLEKDILRLDDLLKTLNE